MKGDSPAGPGVFAAKSDDVGQRLLLERLHLEDRRQVFGEADVFDLEQSLAKPVDLGGELCRQILRRTSEFELIDNLHRARLHHFATHDDGVFVFGLSFVDLAANQISRSARGSVSGNRLLSEKPDWIRSSSRSSCSIFDRCRT